jgi:hypothetical protein
MSDFAVKCSSTVFLVLSTVAADSSPTAEIEISALSLETFSSAAAI